MAYDDRKRARSAVGKAVLRGKMPPARALRCFDCGGAAREYDHARGYARGSERDVEPVCRRCHGKRGVARGETANRARPSSVPRGEARGSAKLDPARVLALRALVAAGTPTAAAGAVYGVSRATVRAIMSGRLWNHVREGQV